jgi:hypothetical protein
MAKGKNHDRKAQKGFGKVKSSAAGGEFNLKKVKGGSVLHLLLQNFLSRTTPPLASHPCRSRWLMGCFRRELLPRCEEGFDGEDVEWREGGAGP